MKGFFAATLMTGFIILCGANAQASWLVDAERFHVSVHGEISCQDCHGDISEKERHPNPVNVTRSLNAFFQPEQCTECHSDTVDDIEAGSHGGEEVAEPSTFNDCINCHDPHYEPAESDEGVRPDLSQPADVKCSLCHELQTTLPELSDEDEACMACHRFLSPESPQAVKKITAFCFHCHGTKDHGNADPNDVRRARIDLAAYRTTAHRDVACTICHPRAPEYNHANQSVGDCRQCHLPHDAKKTAEVHLGVACETCHLNGVTPVKEPGSGLILWKRNLQPNNISKIHHLVTPSDDAACRSCHFDGNVTGAAVMVLPAKSIICMPCHAATFSVGDTTTILGLVVFVMGIIGLGSVWFSGTLPGSRGSGVSSKISQIVKTVIRVIFSTRIWLIFKVLIFDGLLQRRLFRVSRPRWAIHALIFYSFMFRFTWGLVALVASIWFPEWAGAWVMLDKNHPLTAFLFDLSGLVVIIGVIGMVMRRIQSRSQGSTVGLPGTDWPAYGLLGGIIIVGFILEGMRMAMTGSPSGAPYAFIGDSVSRLLIGFDWTGIYGYVWYLHAILTAAFVAYLPFSQMLHMIMAPVVMAMNAGSETDHHASEAGHR